MIIDHKDSLTQLAVFYRLTKMFSEPFVDVVVQIWHLLKLLFTEHHAINFYFLGQITLYITLKLLHQSTFLRDIVVLTEIFEFTQKVGKIFDVRRCFSSFVAVVALDQYHPSYTPYLKSDANMKKLATVMERFQVFQQVCMLIPFVWCFVWNKNT